jgi:hypothetical protein
MPFSSPSTSIDGRTLGLPTKDNKRKQTNFPSSVLLHVFDPSLSGQ